MSDNPPNPATTKPRPSGSAASGMPLPSLAGLAKATGIAAVAAAVLLVFVVLPAEFNIDPTGFGRAIGLTRLSAPADEPAPAAAPSGAAEGNIEDSVVVEVPAGKGVEYKYALRAGGKMQYSWAVDAGSLFYDFHGEPEGDTTGFFESYAVATGTDARGTFTAPFDGIHGWYWKNKGTTPIRVTLVASGALTVVGLR